MSGVYRVYALQSGAGKFYIGFSENRDFESPANKCRIERSTRAEGHGN